jgi:hypothetical protein
VPDGAFSHTIAERRTAGLRPASMARHRARGDREEITFEAKLAYREPDVMPCLRMTSADRISDSRLSATIACISSMDQRRRRAPRVINSIRCVGAVM